MTVYYPSLLREGERQVVLAGAYLFLLGLRKIMQILAGSRRGCLKWCQQVPQLKAQIRAVLLPRACLRRACHWCLLNCSVKKQGAALPLLFTKLLMYQNLCVLGSLLPVGKQTWTLLHLMLGHMSKQIVVILSEEGKRKVFISSPSALHSLMTAEFLRTAVS